MYSVRLNRSLSDSITWRATRRRLLQRNGAAQSTHGGRDTSNWDEEKREEKNSNCHLGPEVTFVMEEASRPSR